MTGCAEVGVHALAAVGAGGDAAKRFTTSAVAIAQLRTYSPERRATVLNGLRQDWSVETEPEIKLSLASTIVGIISPADALPRPNR